MKKIGIAFEGGGLKGSYQIGAYYAIKEKNIKINGIVGASIGAFNAAAIACHNEKKLLSFWQNVNPATILEIDKKFAEYKNGKPLTKDVIIGFKDTLKKIIKNKGIGTEKLKEVAYTIVDEQKLKKSRIDFGLVTVELNKMKPICIFKDKIPKGKLVDYLLASCSLPVFKLEPMINNSIYVDGGFYDNCPYEMLINKNYDEVYAIRIDGIGRDRKVKSNTCKIIEISPSRNICSILELNREKIKENIKMGYYDTKRVINNLDGYRYVFKRVSNKYYEFLSRKITEKDIRRIKNKFNVKTNKEAIIKSLEYILEKEKVDYYQVYNPIIVIKKIKKLPKKKNIVYEFIKKLSIF